MPPAARHQSTRAALKPLHQTPEAAGVAPDVDVGSMPAARDEATLALRQRQEGSALTPTGPPVPKPFTVNTASCHRGANSFEIHCHSKAKRCRVEGLGGRWLESEVVWGSREQVTLLFGVLVSSSEVGNSITSPGEHIMNTKDQKGRQRHRGAIELYI